MKNTSRMLALLLALLLVAVPFASCADTNEPEDTSADTNNGTDTATGEDTAVETEPVVDISSEVEYIRRINATDIEVKFNNKYSGSEDPRSSLFKVAGPDGDRLSLNLDYGYGGAIFFDNMVTLCLAEPLPTDDTAPKITLTYEDITFDVPYDPYYKYEAIAECGIPVRGSAALILGEETVKRGAEMIDMMLSKSPDIVAQMIAGNAQLAVYGNGETAYYIPEHRSSYDATMRYVEGFGGYTSSITESNIWHWRDGNEGPEKSYKTLYINESVLVHEFGHGIKIAGIDAMNDSTLAAEYQMVYRHAVAAGLWANTYAISNSDEFFATMTTIWFNVMNESYNNDEWDGTRGPINTRQELYNYDRDTYNFFAKIYPFTDLDGAWTPVPDTVTVTGLGKEEPVDMTGKEVTFAYPGDANSTTLDFSKTYKFVYADADFILDTSASTSGEGVGLWWDYSYDYPDTAGAMHYTLEQVPGTDIVTEGGNTIYTVYIKSLRDGYLYVVDGTVNAGALLSAVPEEPSPFTITISATGLATLACELGEFTIETDVPDNGSIATYTENGSGWYVTDVSAQINYIAFVHNGEVNGTVNGAMAAEGEVITLKAAAELDGKAFAGWRTTAGTIEDASALETTLTMPAGDVVIWADYQ